MIFFSFLPQRPISRSTELVRDTKVVAGKYKKNQDMLEDISKSSSRRISGKIIAVSSHDLDASFESVAIILHQSYSTPPALLFFKQPCF
jgi:hypothetical protein